MLKPLSLLTFLIATTCIFQSKLAQANVDKCKELKTDCEYYLCIEAQKKCGSKGYLKSFGHKYCQRFEMRSDTYFSLSTQKWIQQTKNCLIKKIDSFSSEKTSCKELRVKAFSSHVSCYVDAGFCEIDKKEKKKIYKIIGAAKLQPRIIKAGLQIRKSCRSRRKLDL